MESSVLEIIGVEIIGVMSPVSICMFLVVLLVYSVSTSSPPLTTIRTAANLVYDENPTDTTTQKLEGSLLNAVVFVILIAVVTFILVLLYYYKCTEFLRFYVRFSTLFVLATMGGSIFLSLIQRFNIPLDSITCFIFLFNFTIVGVLSVFASAIPIIVRQCYTVCLGIIVAAWFTKLPEWTTWTLLVALALYDLVAVLAPGGPLKLLVDLASSRNEELPALIYEARPTVAPAGRAAALGLFVAGVSQSESPSSIELQVVPTVNQNVNESEIHGVGVGGDSVAHVRVEEIQNEEERSLLAGNGNGNGNGNEERSPLVETRNEGEMVTAREEGREIVEDGIKLGLGDFVFYSVLVGRAAMYDLMTVYACYLAIISGLGCTLILLSVYRRALPALPISIALDSGTSTAAVDALNQGLQLHNLPSADDRFLDTGPLRNAVKMGCKAVKMGLTGTTSQVSSHFVSGSQYYSICISWVVCCFRLL